jgi:NADPH:quinone reductase-like Zn-dependent oxidoreductase
VALVLPVCKAKLIIPRVVPQAPSRRNNRFAMLFSFGGRSIRNQRSFIMQAVRIHRFGGPEVMALEEIDRPNPSANEVLIKVFAASVNPVDAKMREGKYPVVTEKDLPYVLGRDVSGQIAAAGDNVSTFRIGDDVFAFLSPEHGGYEEFVLARVDEVAAKPKSLDQVGAAAVPLAGITAWQGLFDHGGLRQGQRVLIHGGAGGVGHFAIQFARQRAPGSQPPYRRPTRRSSATSAPIR